MDKQTNRSGNSIKVMLRQEEIIEQREKQLETLKKWLIDHIDNENFRIQVNMFINDTPEHTCVTVSGNKKYEIASLVLDAMVDRIQFLKSNIQK